LIAGYRFQNALISEGTNSGYAWLENDDGIAYFAVQGHGVYTDGFFYEIVIRAYRPLDSKDDRGGIRASSGGTANALFVGSWIAGTQGPPPQHSDNFQVYYNGGANGYATFRDSVVWPSADKIFQSEESQGTKFTLDNCYLPEPSEANALWPGPGTISLGGYHWIAAGADVTNSTVLGSANNSIFVVTISDSELWNATGYTDGGGNTILGVKPIPPLAPTHEQLDAIWSP